MNFIASSFGTLNFSFGWIIDITQSLFIYFFFEKTDITQLVMKVYLILIFLIATVSNGVKMRIKKSNRPWGVTPNKFCY